MTDNVSDLYTDCLISSFGAAAATGLSSAVGGGISHDKISRLLSRKPETSAYLRSAVRPMIRQSETSGGVLITDDSISEKPPTDENDIICRHCDHRRGRSVKGIGFMTALYHSRKVTLPVGFQIIAETEYHTEGKSGEEKRRCPVGKNRYCREMIGQAADNRTAFRYVLTDVRFASSENMMSVRHELKKSSVMPIETDRKIATTYGSKRKGRYVGADTVVFRTDTPVNVFPEEADFPMFLIRQVFADRDGSGGIPYLITDDMALTYERITNICRKRRNTECYHKPLKQNVSSEKSPGKVGNTQKNRFSACLCGYVKPEMLGFSGRLNHFALKAEICLSALRSAFSELQKLQLLKITA